MMTEMMGGRAMRLMGLSGLLLTVLIVLAIVAPTKHIFVAISHAPDGSR